MIAVMLSPPPRALASATNWRAAVCSGSARRIGAISFSLLM
jgi:hypothetical protein